MNSKTWKAREEADKQCREARYAEEAMAKGIYLLALEIRALRETLDRP